MFWPFAWDKELQFVAFHGFPMNRCFQFSFREVCSQSLRRIQTSSYFIRRKSVFGHSIECCTKWSENTTTFHEKTTETAGAVAIHSVARTIQMDLFAVSEPRCAFLSCTTVVTVFCLLSATLCPRFLILEWVSSSIPFWHHFGRVLSRARCLRLIEVFVYLHKSLLCQHR